MQWFHCNEDKSIYTSGISPDEMQAKLNVAPVGKRLIVLPDGLVGNALAVEPDFSILKEFFRRNVDAIIGQMRLKYVTDIPGQAQTYEKKEREARLWTAGDETANPELYPFMLAEAEIRDISISQVQAEIMEQVNLLTPLASLLEAHRVCIKQKILVADNLPDIYDAYNVDWNSLIPG